MADINTIRTAAGARAAEIDEGLRAHMNKVYGTMSVGMLITFAVAWAVGTSPALLSVFRDPATLQPNILGWIIMFAPLAMVFGFSAMINRFSAAAAQLFFYAFAAVMGLCVLRWGPTPCGHRGGPSWLRARCGAHRSGLPRGAATFTAHGAARRVARRTPPRPATARARL